MKRYKIVIEVLTDDEWEDYQELLKNLYKQGFKGVVDKSEFYEIKK